MPTAALMMLAGLLAAPAPDVAPSPSFDCARAQGGVEKLICADAALAALDRRLDEVYGEALARTFGASVASLQAEQRGWVEGREDCSKAADARACVQGAYERRIVQLQVEWQLVPTGRRATFVCAGKPGETIVVRFYETDPSAAVVERGAEHVLLIARGTAGGVRHEGAGVSFVERGDEAGFEWKGARLTCRAQR